MIRFFEGLESFGRFLGESAERSERVHKEAVKLAAEVLYVRSRSIFGDSAKLASLADATQADRVKKGYSANDPLLRNGKLLRDSVSKDVDDDSAFVGSDEPIMAYHEFGYFNVRAGKMVPPRPVFGITLSESAKDLEAITADAIGVTLGNPSALALAILEEE